MSYLKEFVLTVFCVVCTLIIFVGGLAALWCLGCAYFN